MQSGVPSQSDLCFGLCRLRSPEQLVALSHGCVLDQGKIQLKQYAFSITVIGTIFCVHTFSPPDPSRFVLGHPELCSVMFSLVDIALLQNEMQVLAALARLKFL